MVSLPLALAMLLLVFGSMIAAGMPLRVGALAGSAALSVPVARLIHGRLHLLFVVSHFREDMLAVLYGLTFSRRCLHFWPTG